MSKYDNNDADDDTTLPATVFVFDCDRYYQTNNLLLWTFRSFFNKRKKTRQNNNDDNNCQKKDTSLLYKPNNAQ